MIRRIPRELPPLVVGQVGGLKRASDSRDDTIKKSGPNSEEETLIRQLHAGGASREDILAAVPDVHPDAVDAWIRSLERAVKA